MTTEKQILRKLREYAIDPLFIAFLILFLMISTLYISSMKYSLDNFPMKIWVSIAGLMIITKSIERSDMFYHVSEKMLTKFKDERMLAIFLSFLSAGIATFLTNDITLFIVIPLTMSIQKTIKNDIMKIVIFEAIGANVGSMLTPIGNPQNLYIWHVWGISFLQFTEKMILPTSISLIILIVFILVVFPKRNIAMENLQEHHVNRLEFALSSLLLAAFVVFMEFGLVYYGIIVVVISYALFSPRTFAYVDWFLLVTFALIFLSFGALPSVLHTSTLPPHPANLFLVSSFMSQFVSNVPAAVFLLHISNDYLPIAWGVNVGGNGIIIGSIANIIALRLSRRKKMLIEFHRYSIPYFIITLILVYLIVLI